MGHKSNCDAIGAAVKIPTADEEPEPELAGR